MKLPSHKTKIAKLNHENIGRKRDYFRTCMIDFSIIITKICKPYLDIRVILPKSVYLRML